MGAAAISDKAREEELARLMRLYGGMIAGLCAAFLGDLSLGQDTAQETFLHAYRKLPGFRGGRKESEKAWLTRIALNLCKDQKRSGWFRFVDRKITPDILSEPAAPQKDQDDRLFRAVMALPEKEKKVVVLHFFQDMDAEEIACALHIGRSSVYRRLNQAIKNLKKTLEEGKDDEE